MPLARFEKLDGARRAQILGAAAREFARHGFGGASVNRILLDAGLSKGVLYYYFTYKDDLYRAVLSSLLDELLVLMQPECALGSATAYWAEWEAIYARMIRHLTREPVAATLLWEAIRSRAGGSGHAALAELAAKLRERIRALLSAGREIAAVRDDLPEQLLLHASFGLLEGVDRWFADEWESGNPIAPERLAATAIELLRRLVEAPRRKRGSR